MPNPTLSPEELLNANALLDEVRARLKSLAGGDSALLFAYRRKIYKELTYDERGKPTQRKRLKELKRRQQADRCADCGGPLPAQHAVLDRLHALLGYTEDNTRLLCRECDAEIQARRRYK